MRRLSGTARRPTLRGDEKVLERSRVEPVGKGPVRRRELPVAELLLGLVGVQFGRFVLAQVVFVLEPAAY